MPTAEIIVLARSKKLGGLCVAGISTDTGRWVRPVSAHPHGQLEPGHCAIGRRPPSLLDVVELRYVEPLENPAQPENVLIDELRPWERVGVVDPADAYERLAGKLVPGPRLLGNRGKAVPEEEAAGGVEESLALIEPSGPVEFMMKPPEETYGKRKPRAVFQLAGRRYELGLTDKWVEQAVLSLGVGEYTTEQLGFGSPARVLLTVSLGEAHEGWHSKLAAAVLFLP
jgi:hypothetical protein